MSSGHDDNGGGGDLNTGILQQILAALGDLGGRIDETNLRLEVGFRDVNARLDQTNARLDQTNGRLDNLIAVSGQSWRDLERRVAALEARVPATE